MPSPELEKESLAVRNGQSLRNVSDLGLKPCLFSKSPNTPGGVGDKSPTPLSLLVILFSAPPTSFLINSLNVSDFLICFSFLNRMKLEL